MIIDCDGCEVRGLACDDCVVSVLLGGTPDGPGLDAEQCAAIGVLAGSGLVPPLRLVPRERSPAAPQVDRRDAQDPRTATG